MLRAIRFELKNIVLKREFGVIFVLCVLLAGAAYCELIQMYWGLDEAETRSAIDAFMLWPYRGIGPMFILCLIPLFTAICCGDSYYNELKSGTIIPIIVRQNRSRYYHSKLIAIAICSFFISVLPLILNQILCLIAFPSRQLFSYISGSIYDANMSWDIEYVLFPELYMNSPYAHNAVHTIMTGMVGAVWGMLTYSISLFFRKNILLTVGMTTVISMLQSMIFTTTGKESWDITSYLYANPYSSRSIIQFSIIWGTLLLINIVAVQIKIRRNKDVL